VHIEKEGKMFKPIKDFLKEDYECLESTETFGYDSHEGIPPYTGYRLQINDYCSNPDVYGISGDKIILCQGKLIRNKKGKLWELVGQAVSDRNYCHYLYIFFEKDYLEKIKKNDNYKDLNFSLIFDDLTCLKQ